MAPLSKELDLSQDQKEKIRPLIEEQAKQMHELRENTDLTPDQRREKAGALMKETHDKIAAVLNPEQKERLKQHMEQMREHRAAEHKEPPTKQ
jgi:Spy/CpxP family protein refolding chaperone